MEMPMPRRFRTAKQTSFDYDEVGFHADIALVEERVNEAWVGRLMRKEKLPESTRASAEQAEQTLRKLDRLRARLMHSHPNIEDSNGFSVLKWSEREEAYKDRRRRRRREIYALKRDASYWRTLLRAASGNQS
jgi:hypothetical protein